MLDVLHNAPDQDALAVAYAVHVDLGGEVEKAVQQHGARVGHVDRGIHVGGEVLVAVHDFHGAPAEHV